MKKIMLRKNYQTKVVSVDDAVGYYLAEPVMREWDETFIDEDTQEHVVIKRSENIVLRGFW